MWQIHFQRKLKRVTRWLISPSNPQCSDGRFQSLKRKICIGRDQSWLTEHIPVLTLLLVFVCWLFVLWDIQVLCNLSWSFSLPALPRSTPLFLSTQLWVFSFLTLQEQFLLPQILLDILSFTGAWLHSHRRLLFSQQVTIANHFWVYAQFPSSFLPLGWFRLAWVLNMLSKSLCTAALHIWKITFACSHLPTSTLLWTLRPVLEKTLFWRVSHSRVC